LVNDGNTVLIIGYNVEVIKNTDWIIDLGSESGDKGGSLCFAGLTEDLAKEKDNHTARYLKEKI